MRNRNRKCAAGLQRLLYDTKTTALSSISSVKAFHGPVVSPLLLSTWCLSTICWGRDTGAFQIPHQAFMASTSNVTESWFNEAEMIKRRSRFFDKMSLKQCKSPSISPFICFFVLLFSFLRLSLLIHQGYILNKINNLMQKDTTPMTSGSNVCLIKHSRLFLLAHIFSTCEPKPTQRHWFHSDKHVACLSSPPNRWKKPFIWLLFRIKCKVCNTWRFKKKQCHQVAPFQIAALFYLNPLSDSIWTIALLSLPGNYTYV